MTPQVWATIRAFGGCWTVIEIAEKYFSSKSTPVPNVKQSELISGDSLIAIVSAVGVPLITHFKGNKRLDKLEEALSQALQ